MLTLKSSGVFDGFRKVSEHRIPYDMKHNRQIIV
jgi:hypothetical protein